MMLMSKKITFLSDKQKRHMSVACYFAGLNRRTKKGLSFLFLAVMLVVSTMSFLFIGELYAYADDTLTKKYDSSAYSNEDNTRLAVRHPDGSEITDEEIEEIKALDYVVTVDPCEYCNDINYYYQLGEDYRIRYADSTALVQTKESYVYSFINDDHFMRSAGCIEESDLKFGRIPDGLGEIAIYSEDESLLGTTVTMYFRDENLWGSNAWCSYEMTIVGILKEDADQVYFSEAFCLMLGSFMDTDGRFQLYWDFTGGYADPYYQTLIPIVNEDLEGMQARVGGYALSSEENASDVIYKETDSVQGRFLEQDLHGELIFTNLIDLTFYVADENLANNSTDFLEISAELFYTYYTPMKTQAAVYIADYAKTDDVLNRLTRMGYEAISTWRVSASEYDEETVNNRMMILGISAAGLLVLALMAILVLYSLMKLRKKDFAILKFLGMRTKMLRSISYFEMGAHCVIAMAISLIVIFVLRIAGIEAIDTMMWYVRWHSYALLIVYNLTVCVLAVIAFNWHLRKWLNRNSLLYYV